MSDIKSKIWRILCVLAGNDIKTCQEEQFFNLLVFIVACFHIVFLIIYINANGILPFIIIFHTLTLVWIIASYFFSRIQRKNKLASILFNCSFLLSFAINWIYAGASSGVFMLYYFTVLVIVLLLVKRPLRMLFTFVNLFSLIFLFVIEKKSDLFRQEIFYANAVYVHKIISIAFTLIIIISIYSMKKVVYDESNKRKIEKLNELTCQERKVLDLRIKGKSNKEIAHELCVEVSTIKTHINNINKKLGTTKKMDLFNYRSTTT